MHTYIVPHVHAKVRLGRAAVHSCSNLLIAFADVRQREAAGVLHFTSFAMNFAREAREIERTVEREK